MSVPEAVASSAVKTHLDTKAACIIVCSETGNSVRLVAKYRPNVPILCITNSDSVARQVEGTCRGVRAAVIGSMMGTDAILLTASEMVKGLGWAKAGDTMVAVYGTIEGAPGSTNVMKAMTVV